MNDLRRFLKIAAAVAVVAAIMLTGCRTTKQAAKSAPDEVGNAAVDEATEAAKEEARKAVREGMNNIFGK
jgi:hypothetical protein